MVPKQKKKGLHCDSPRTEERGTRGNPPLYLIPLSCLALLLLLRTYFQFLTCVIHGSFIIELLASLEMVVELHTPVGETRQKNPLDPLAPPVSRRHLRDT